jgi:hypothetical protein
MMGLAHVFFFWPFLQVLSCQKLLSSSDIYERTCTNLALTNYTHLFSCPNLHISINSMKQNDGNSPLFDYS